MTASACSAITEEIMALTPSTMLPLGTPAPDFSLPATDGSIVSLKSFKNNKLLVVAFICNHCPFVKHIRSRLAEVGRDYQAKGGGLVEIKRKDIVVFPANNMKKMRGKVREVGLRFHYVLVKDRGIAGAKDGRCI